MPEQALPVVAVLATGGTIAGAQADATSAGYTSGSFSVSDLLAADVYKTQVVPRGTQAMGGVRGCGWLCA